MMHDAPVPPVRVGVWQAIRRHPLAFMVPVVALLAVGTAVALNREPVHTAESRLLIGRFDVEAQAVPGYVEASESLADTLSRVAETGVVLAPAAEALGQAPETLVETVEVSPVAESSVIRIQATGSTEALAVRRAEAVTAALVEYEQGLGAAAGAEAVLEEYRAAAQRLSEAATQRERLLAQLGAAETAAEGQALRGQLIEAEAVVATAQLEVDTLGTRYQDILRGAGSGGIRVVSDGRALGDDGARAVQMVLALALIAGIAVGAAAATALANLPAGSRLVRSSGATRRTVGSDVASPA